MISRATHRRHRVALAGFGVVGAGVYHRLAADPASFEIVAILCRDPGRRRAQGGPVGLLTSDTGRLADCDMLVEVIGGVDDAFPLVRNALRSGADVVTANKSLVSRHYRELQTTAQANGARLRYSASVGGGVPMLETVTAASADGGVDSIEAVLNGTTNFVLDRMGAGASLDAAVKEAQAAGFAEADPSKDIDGIDAAEKLSLLARAAFGAEISPDDIPRDALAGLGENAVRSARESGRPYKQIASARRRGARIDLEVRLRETMPGEDLGAPKREENCLVVICRNGGRIVVSGKGAGREPTAGSILADIQALAAFAPEAGANKSRTGLNAAINGLATTD